MDRLLLLMTTTTYRAGAFLEAARRLGVPVVVGSDRPQVLESANPAGHLTLDFLAPENAAHAIVEFARRYPIRAVIAADDDGAILAAMAAAALRLTQNSVDAVAAARDKHRMREVLAAAGVPSPHAALFSLDDDPRDLAGRVNFPCVVKPLFLSASRGVIRANDPDEFVLAFDRLAGILGRPEVAAQGGSLARQILVETYIPGAEVAVEGLLSRGKLRVLAIFDKPDPMEGPFFEETIYATPSRLQESVQQSIVACTAQAVAALGLTHGPIHAELRVNDRGPWILEVAPRSIGGLCSRALRFGEGISLEELILRHAIGLEVDSISRERQAAGVMMIPIPQSGVLRAVRGQEEARAVPGIEEVRLTIPLGEAVVPLPEGSRYLGFIFARAETPAEVEAALREAHSRLTFLIRPPEDPPQGGSAGSGVSAAARRRAASRVQGSS
jgi:biotin carboxylase